MLIYNKQNIIPAATILNANVNSAAMQLENMLGYAIQVVIASFRSARRDPLPSLTIAIRSSFTPR